MHIEWCGVEEIFPLSRHKSDIYKLGILDEQMELFVPPENADTDEAAQYCFGAQKI